MKIILVLTLLTIITSCSSRIGVRTPATKFLSPEAIGKRFMGDITVFNTQGTHADLDLRNNQADNPLDLTRKTRTQVS